MNRRKFIQSTAALAAGTLLQQCHPPGNLHINGAIVGANHTAGHLMRDSALLAQPATSTIRTRTLIIGGGVSGLSAARYLQQQGQRDFLLLELDEHTGGNAASGQNAVSAYPWGAHYVPIPNNDCTEYLQFLESCGVITGYENGLPLVNEYQLCFAPQERLYINGRWQEGLIPDMGVPPAEQQQIKQFLASMQTFRTAIGNDGKAAFAIPVAASSRDAAFTQLDAITMREWLQQQGLTSKYLHWYVNYCCRDDFGTDYQYCSAWAGIHYFAGRKGRAANAPAQSVITWPEGNHWLVKQLQRPVQQMVRTNTMALQVTFNADNITVKTINTVTRKITNIEAANCIIATPQFVAARLLQQPQRSALVQQHFHYQPWMVANITCNHLEERSGPELCWDNVLYQSKALGYVSATHQQTNLLNENKVLTYYWPLTAGNAHDERKQAMERTHADWTNMICKDLSTAHADLAIKASQIDVWVWGHGMISPRPGFILGEAKAQLQHPLDKRIFFAHTDLSGISIFEEAFYQGINAAKQCIHT